MQKNTRKNGKKSNGKKKKTMKKVIKGSLYNTETAQELGYTGYSNSTDFEYWYEALYRTRSGKYFLYCEGGPLSKYAIVEGDNRSGDVKIAAFSREDARKWAEKNLDGDEYIAAFGNPEEDEMTVLHLEPFPAAAKALLQSEKEKTGRSYTEIVAELIENNLQ